MFNYDNFQIVPFKYDNSFILRYSCHDYVVNYHTFSNAKITCDFGDDRCGIASALLEKDIVVKTHLHTARIVVQITITSILLYFCNYLN